MIKSLFKTFFLTELLGGLRLTLRNLFVKKVTIMYGIGNRNEAFPISDTMNGPK